MNILSVNVLIVNGYHERFCRERFGRERFGRERFICEYFIIETGNHFRTHYSNSIPNIITNTERREKNTKRNHWVKVCRELLPRFLARYSIVRQGKRVILRWTCNLRNRSRIGLKNTKAMFLNGIVLFQFHNFHGIVCSLTLLCYSDCAISLACIMKL